MPNWCENRVTVWGNEPGEVEKLIDFVKGEHEPFDFQKIIPMPEAFVGIISGSCKIDGETVREWREVDGKAVAVSDEERAELKRLYGAANWYDWCCKHWDTKWNACHMQEPEIEEYGAYIEQITYRFDTAWGPPNPICMKLREEFPNLHIQWFWDEPGMGEAGYL
jgi:hypothetical protein